MENQSRAVVEALMRGIDGSGGGRLGRGGAKVFRVSTLRFVF